jgi:GDPmannose 4,6-dehydratase
MKIAIITGITGQDGSYLAELLLEKGYTVHGIVRRSSTNGLSRIQHLLDEKKLHLHVGDLTDSASILRIVNEVKPDEIYNLAAQSDVKLSFDTAENTADSNALGALRILEAIRHVNTSIKFYQASTSEMFGKVQEIPQTEKTPFYPRSPYGVSKLYSHWITKNYRESYNIFACSGILFNHESPRRGENFVTQKVVKALFEVSTGKINSLEIGNLDAKRDWGHAKDYVKVMWSMLQADSPDDYVVATGEQHSVREFVEKSAKHFGMNIKWVGEGLDEIGIDNNTGKIVVTINPEYFRPAEVESLIGDSTLAKEKLGWIPKITFDELVEDMCNSFKEGTK